PSQYYLFHNTVDDSVAYAYHIYYSEIDMSLNSGLGAVTSKNNVLLNDTLIPGRITAVKHGNGRDWWVVFHKGHMSRYFIYLVDTLGIHFHSSQDIGPNLSFALGQACFSPDGSKFAMYDALNDLEIMDFDRCLGQFRNPVHVPINDSAVSAGVAFSPNSLVLYASSMLYIYQFDLTDTNISSTKTTVAVWDNSYSPNPPAATIFYQCKLAPDGKIYLSCANSTLDLHVINYPDSLGLGCNVCQHCIHLPAYNAFTIPNHPNYHLGSLSGSLCDTITSVQNLQVQSSTLELFPNPVRERVYASLNQTVKIKNVKVLNAFGQEMPVNYSIIKNGEYIEVNTSSLSQGVYYLELLSEKEKLVKKFVCMPNLR
ncbi:MAG: T9SS type A sorting domain-containing protein, partial [Bacteroidetes bacterium]|nr:T9SS type A sorting domain-containing protein [Bacteroidota bacterium]